MFNILPKIPKRKRKKLEVINVLFIIAICGFFLFYNEKLSISMVYAIGLSLLILQIIINIIYYKKHKI